MKNKTLMIYVLGMGGSSLLGLLTFPALAWSFSAENIGRLSLFQVMTSLAVLVLSLGLDQAYVREYHEVSDRSLLAKTMLIPGFILIFFLSLFFPLIIPYCTLFAKVFVSNNVTLFLLAILILYFERFFSVFIRMKEFVHLYALSKLLSKASFLVLILIPFFWEDLKTLNFVMSAQITAWGISVFLMFVFLKNDFLDFLKAKFDKKIFGEGMRFGLPLAVNGAAFWGLSSLDRIMLERYSSLSEVGVYSLALGLSGVAILGQQLFSILWLPTIYKWNAQGVEVNRVVVVYEKVQFVSLSLITLVGMFSWLIPLFLPPQYKNLQGFVVTCMIAPLFIMVSEVSGVGISITRRTQILPAITVFSLVVNILLNYTLIPILGAAGAAIATAISFLSYLFLKTKISSLIWKKLPNMKMYVSFFLIVFLSIISALYASEHVLLFVAVWLFAFSSQIFSYRQVFLEIVVDIKKRYC